MKNPGAEINKVTLKEYKLTETEVVVPAPRFNSCSVCVLRNEYVRSDTGSTVCFGVDCCNCVFSNKNFALFMKGATS